MIYCDWCEQAIDGDCEVAYSIEALPFDPLRVTSQVKGDGPKIITEIHVHAHPCRENLIADLILMVRDHEATDAETDSDHKPQRRKKDGGEATEEELKREREDEQREQWRKLDNTERERLTLEAFRDEGVWLTNRQVTERLIEADGPAPYLCATDVAAYTRALKEKGELEGQPGQWGNARIRYRRPPVSPELRELAEQLSSGEGD